MNSIRKKTLACLKVRQAWLEEMIIHSLPFPQWWLTTWQSSAAHVPILLSLGRWILKKL